MAHVERGGRMHVLVSVPRQLARGVTAQRIGARVARHAVLPAPVPEPTHTVVANTALITPEQAQAFTELGAAYVRQVGALFEAFRPAVAAYGRNLFEAMAEMADAFDRAGIMGDTWSEPEGCWADVWFEHAGEYDACNGRPDAGSELGLCAEHEAKMASLRERAS